MADGNGLTTRDMLIRLMDGQRRIEEQMQEQFTAHDRRIAAMEGQLRARKRGAEIRWERWVSALSLAVTGFIAIAGYIAVFHPVH